MPVILALGRLRQEDCAELEACLDYTEFTSSLQSQSKVLSQKTDNLHVPLM